jgi:hypothetical protein
MIRLIEKFNDHIGNRTHKMGYITEEFFTLSLFLGILDAYRAMSAAFDSKKN